MTVLIFPAGMPRSLEYMRRAVKDGKSVIGASSLKYDSAKNSYPNWLYLPYVSAPDFLSELAEAIAQHGIDEIYTPNPVVWPYLQRKLPELSPGVTLLGGPPDDEVLEAYQMGLKFARSILAEHAHLASALPCKPQRTLVEIASLYLHAEAIPGQCSHDKMRALIDVARCCPSGDLVEIGSLWGKSAYMLGQLARYYEIGSLLCVDPWSNDHLVQHDDSGLVDEIANQLDTDMALTAFQMTMTPYAAGKINYLRLPSTQAADRYATTRTIKSEALGETEYCGEVALLHVDGNHSYENAKGDILAWSRFVMPYGWIIIDDYRWPYGDGPRRAGNEFLCENIENIACAFVSGGALFLQLAGRT